MSSLEALDLEVHRAWVRLLKAMAHSDPAEREACLNALLDRQLALTRRLI